MPGFTRQLAFIALFSVVVTPLVLAQPKEQFAQAQQENRAALQQYMWESRTEIKMKGESKSVKLEQVRYDADGKQQKTEIGEPAPQAQESGGGKRRGRRGGGRVKEKVVDNKKKEFAELMKGLGQLVASYAHLPPEKMQAFAKNATTSPGEGDMANALMIQGKDVQVPGDTMAVWVDTTSFMMRRLEIHTLYDNNPVTFSGEFGAIPDGPTYPAHLVLEYPDKEVELVIDNSKYQRSAGDN